MISPVTETPAPAQLEKDAIITALDRTVDGRRENQGLPGVGISRATIYRRPSGTACSPTGIICCPRDLLASCLISS